MFIRAARAAPAVLLLAAILARPSPTCAEAANAVREFTLENAQPGSRTHWRIPEPYLAHFLSRARSEAPVAVINIEAALPHLAAWWSSGLHLGRDDHLKLHVPITVEASSGFAVEKRLLPDTLEDLQLVDESGDYQRYRAASRSTAAATGAPAPNETYLVPKTQMPGRIVFFRCRSRCTAFTDLTENVAIQYGIDLQIVLNRRHWDEVDTKVRGLLAAFMVK